MIFDTPWLPVIIFFARIVDVSLGTVRTICVVRGYRSLATVLAFCEVVVWIYAVAGVFVHLDRIENVLAYAAGFAAGNGVGMWIEQRLALGMQMIMLVSKERGLAVAERLSQTGLPVTTLNADAHDGPATVSVAVVPRRQIASVVALATNLDSGVKVTITDVRQDGAAAAVGKLGPLVGLGVRPQRTRPLRLSA